MYKLTTLALAAAATAIPTSILERTSCDTGFTTQMNIGGTGGILSLEAVQNGTNTGLILIGQPSSTSPGSTVDLTGTSPNAALSFDIDGQEYPWFVGDVGHVDGAVQVVTAQMGPKNFEFTVADDGSIYPKLTAAINQWLACNYTVNGNPAVVLAWGNSYFNGSLAQGCGFASVKQVCGSSTAITYA